MRSIYLLVLLFLCPGLIEAQSNLSHEQRGVILIRVSSTLGDELNSAFDKFRPADDPDFSHTDINAVAITGDSSIEDLLSLPNALHSLRLKPFIPTHSVAFEDIRERTNRELFIKQPQANGTLLDNNSNLRNAEDKISRWFALYYSDSVSGDRAASFARKSPFVEIAEPIYSRETCYMPNDSFLFQQYALRIENAFKAWDIVKCDSTMIVADADIGTDWTHPDLAASIYLNQGEIGIDTNGIDKRANGVDDDGNGFIDDWHGWDFAGTNGATPDNNAMPGGGSHGTHTAGILAATGDNMIGIAGVAYGSRLIPIKICDNNEGNFTFGFEAIIYAADMHAKVVNCSWGGSTRLDAEQDAINYAYAKDCAVVAACGNNGDKYPYQDFFPAAYDHVLSVAMLDVNGNMVSGSNYNTHVDVGAPGWSVYSTLTGGGYGTMDGTSMASPNAAGVVALVRQRFPTMTAGQAMEQVRVTCDSIPGIWYDRTGAFILGDSSRNYYEGHGAVDAYRAVTETNTHSARIESVKLADDNNTGYFAPGESGGIVLSVRNFLQPLSQLKARLEIVQGGDVVTLHQTTVPFGAAGTMSVVQNDISTFQISVAPNVAPNTLVLIRVFFYDSTLGYKPDYDYFSFVINPSYLDLNANNLTVTFAAKGSIGYQDVLINKEGSGFRWQKPPASISPYGKTQLYSGGLIVGTDQTHIVDVVESRDDPNFADEDLTPEINIHYTPPDRPNAVQELAYVLTDSLADSARQAGVRVNCNAYEYNYGLSANAVIVNYVFRAKPSSTGLPPSDATSAALFMDWDVGLDGSVNVTKFDSATSTAVTYRLQPNYPHIGMRLLSTIPEGASLNYHAILNDQSQGDIYTYGPFYDSLKWLAMNEFFPSVGPGDISLSFGLKNMPLASQDSVEMTIVMALAENDSLLNQTLDLTSQMWFGTASVNQPDEIWQPILEVFPNPFTDKLHISWSLPEQSNSMPSHISIYDELGRTVASQDVPGSQFEFAPTNLSHGFYVVDVMVGGTHLRRQVVSTGQ